MKALDFHQNREWFVENKDLFEQQLKEPLGDLVDELTGRFEKAGLPFKGDRVKSQFRIKRDTRFSRTKHPITATCLHCCRNRARNGTKAGASMSASACRVSATATPVWLGGAEEGTASGYTHGHCREAGRIPHHGRETQEKRFENQRLRPAETHAAWF
ncbi:DUF2461 family protein [Ochrobactrum oryzae]|nr:DUF2461 family protein [Brucella oryzae]